jgi:hypothetical protein
VITVWRVCVWGGRGAGVGGVERSPPDPALLVALGMLLADVAVGLGIGMHGSESVLRLFGVLLA